MSHSPRVITHVILLMVALLVVVLMMTLMLILVSHPKLTVSLMTPTIHNIAMVLLVSTVVHVVWIVEVRLRNWRSRG